MSDQQQEEWEAWERDQLAKRRCPASGGLLIRRQYDDGPPDPTGGVMSCGVCDCFGYTAGHVVPDPVWGNHSGDHNCPVCFGSCMGPERET